MRVKEFQKLCEALFVNECGIPYDLPDKLVKDFFETFDVNKDGIIDQSEQVFMSEKWVEKILNPVPVLVVVDVQNDFINGSLAISKASSGSDGAEVIAPINKLLDTINFRSVYYTKDWHPMNHISFLETADEFCDFSNGNEMITTYTAQCWPRHCVQHTWGAELHNDLKIVEGSRIIVKGTTKTKDSYSAFTDMEYGFGRENSLKSCLDAVGATDVFICGLAYDVCVRATAFDSLSSGFRTIVVNDACRGTNLHDVEATKNTLKDRFGVIVESHEVKAMAEGENRKPELAKFIVERLKLSKSDLY